MLQYVCQDDVLVGFRQFNILEESIDNYNTLTYFLSSHFNCIIRCFYTGDIGKIRE